MPCSVNLKVNNASKIWRFNGCGHCKLKFTQSNKIKNNLFSLEEKSSQPSLGLLAEPIYINSHFRHPKEGRFNSHRVNPRFPLSAPKVAHTYQCLFGFNTTRGNCEAFRTGGVAPLGEDTRVETANEGKAFITCERADGPIG